MFILDTNVISELRKVSDGRAAPSVVTWVTNVDHSTLYISVITLMEIELGILRIGHRDFSQAARLRTWMDTIVRPQFAHRVLSIDSDISLCCAKLHVPDPKSDRDAWIAATALVHNMTVVTRNIVDFAKTGARLLDPWQSPP